MESLQTFISPGLIWFLIGLVFILLEFIIPGVIIIFFGVGAWVTALALLFFNFGINTQLVIFLVASLVFLVVLRNKVQSIFVGKSEGNINEEIDGIIGQKVKVTRKITPNEAGKVLLNGTSWRAESVAKIEVDSIVEIIDKNNLTLIVKPLKKE
ncbi:MAG: NfeD family protein [Fidelibacterota bacterium]